MRRNAVLPSAAILVLALAPTAQAQLEGRIRSGDVERLQRLARELDSSARRAHDLADRERHHFDARESDALARLRELVRATGDLRRAAADARRARDADPEVRLVLASHREAEAAMSDLHGYREVGSEFRRTSELVGELARDFPPEREDDRHGRRDDKPREVTLAAGTTLLAAFEGNRCNHTFTDGEQVDLRLTEEVAARGYLVLPKGAEVVARVTKREGGRGADELGFQVVRVQIAERSYDVRTSTARFRWTDRIQSVEVAQGADGGAYMHKGDEVCFAGGRGIGFRLEEPLTVDATGFSRTGAGRSGHERGDGHDHH